MSLQLRRSSPSVVTACASRPQLPSASAVASSPSWRSSRGPYSSTGRSARMPRVPQVGTWRCSSWRSSAPPESLGLRSSPLRARFPRRRDESPWESWSRVAVASSRSPQCPTRWREFTRFRAPLSNPTHPASCKHISSVGAAAAAGSSGPLRSMSGAPRRSSAQARARSLRGGPSTDPCGCSSATRIRSTSRASANSEPLVFSSSPRSGSVAARSAARTCRRTEGEARTSLAAAHRSCSRLRGRRRPGLALAASRRLPRRSLGACARPRPTGAETALRVGRRGIRGALAGLALAVVVLEFVPLLAGLALNQSRQHALDGRPLEARDAALRARALEPWATATARATRVARRVARRSSRGTAVGRRRAPTECRRLAGASPRSTDRDAPRRSERCPGRSSSGAAPQPAFADLCKRLTPVHGRRRHRILSTGVVTPPSGTGRRGIVLMVSRAADETQAAPVTRAPSRGRRRFRRDSLRRRMIALGDGMAVAVAAVAVWASGAPAESAAAIVLFIPGWLLVAKVCGLYDRDHRSIRCLTIDELGRIVGVALAGTTALATVLLVLGFNELSTSVELRLWILVAASIFVFRVAARAMLAAGDAARARADPRRRPTRGRDTAEARALPGHPCGGGRHERGTEELPRRRRIPRRRRSRHRRVADARRASSRGGDRGRPRASAQAQRRAACSRDARHGGAALAMSRICRSSSTTPGTPAGRRCSANASST